MGKVIQILRKIMQFLIRMEIKKEKLNLNEELARGYAEYYKDYKSDPHEWDEFYKEWCIKHNKTRID